MFCPKCGVRLPDGSKFCGACGERLTDATSEIQNEQNAADASAWIPVVPVNIPKPDFVQPKKKVGSKTIIGIAIAGIVVTVAILAIVAIWGLKSLFFGFSGGNAYAYLSDGKYELITNLDKEQTIEIASSKSDSTMASLLAFSPDGKYVYYYTKYDSYYGSGSLCRAEYGKLKEDSNKNDKYIEIIATDVSLGFRFLDDGAVTYKNSDGTLYCFNGEESTQIAKNVSYYFTDGSDKIVYATGDYSEGYTLYGVELSDIDNKIKLASYFEQVFNASDFENILYTKYEDDGTETLYVVGFEKETEKLAESVSYLTQFDGKTYFTAENGEMLSLYDFVVDTHADSDEARDRILMRETLQNKENDYAVRTLYCFDKGTLTAVNETVLNTRSYTGAIVFNTTDMITETVKIEDLYSAYDVLSLFDVNNEAENYIILADGTSCRMSINAAETFAEANDNGYVTLYFTNKEVYMSEGNGALSMATINGGVVGDFTIVTDDAKVLSVDGSILYYASESYQNNDVTYCDLYSCSNGTNTRMARDVILNNINLYSDGVILAYTGVRASLGHELTMIDSKGKTTLIGDNVTQYIRVDKSTLLYISDGDLYSYNGKEKSMVRSEVDWFWSQNSMEIDNTFGWYYYDYYN